MKLLIIALRSQLVT